MTTQTEKPKIYTPPPSKKTAYQRVSDYAKSLGYYLARSDSDFMRFAVVSEFEYLLGYAFPWSVYPNLTQAYCALSALARPFSVADETLEWASFSKGGF